MRTRSTDRSRLGCHYHNNKGSDGELVGLLRCAQIHKERVRDLGVEQFVLVGKTWGSCIHVGIVYIAQLLSLWWTLVISVLVLVIAGGGGSHHSSCEPSPSCGGPPQGISQLDPGSFDFGHCRVASRERGWQKHED